MNLNSGVLDGLRRIGASVRDLTIGGQIAGAPLGFRLRGATPSGSPVTGTWKARDVVIDATGAVWICAAGGTPGTWVSSSAAGGALLAANNLSDVAARQTALNNLAGAVTGGQFLRGNGSNIHLAAILPGDLPALGWIPADHGVQAWAYDPALVAANNAPPSGTIVMIGVQVPAATTVTKIYLVTGGTAASGVTASENFVGLYSSTALLASAATDSSFSSTFALVTVTISSQNLAAGQYWVAFVMNATTMPSLGNMWGANGSTGLLSLGLTSTTYRYATGGTGATSLPGTTPTLTAAGKAYWAAIG